jgi:lysophospholipase L1-like esterase
MKSLGIGAKGFAAAAATGLAVLTTGLAWAGGSTASADISTRGAETGEFLSAKPAVRVEYWQRREAEITAYLKQSKSLSPVRLVFLGDSITDFWGLGNNPWVPGQVGGRAIWEESFSGRPPEDLGLNLGISGDRTEHVLYRLLPKSAGGQGELDSQDLNPEFVILLVGINNTWDAESPVIETVFGGIRAVITAVHERKPNATLVVQSLLPTNDEAKNRDIVLPVNHRLSELAGRPQVSDYLVYLDLYGKFADPKGAQIRTDRKSVV